MVLNVVIMAAGKGTRMRSARPKVLHGSPVVIYCSTFSMPPPAWPHRARSSSPATAPTEVERAAAAPALAFVRQEPQLGTGHAVQQAAPMLDDAGTTLILNGDVPLIEAETLRALVAASAGGKLALLTVALDDPTGYGRVVRRAADATNGPGTIEAIVEEKDATPEQRRIAEVYTGFLAAPTASLKRWLAALRNDNAAGEYYLTDVVRLAVAEAAPVVGVAATSATEVLGVNSPTQLAELERRYQARAAARLMEGGVRLADPARFDVRGELHCDGDVEIDIGCIFEGRVALGAGVRIGAYCMVRNATIAAGATIRPYSHIDGEALGASVGVNAVVGPFARLRGGAELAADVHVGNFVEIKNSTLARGAKANHLAYIGDSSVGERVNFGAGSITANYDGAEQAPHRHRRRRAHRQQLRAGRAGRGRRRRDGRRRLDLVARRTGRPADRGAQPRRRASPNWKRPTKKEPR